MSKTLLLAAIFICFFAVLYAPQSSFACANQGSQAKEISTGAYEEAIICLTNKERGQRGLGDLKENAALNSGATMHNNVMLKGGCFSHQCGREADLSARLRISGYIRSGVVWMVGENIAWGSERLSTPKAIVTAWMRSPDHRANILNRKFKHIGVAAAWGRPGSAGADAVTVTQDFGMLKG